MFMKQLVTKENDMSKSFAFKSNTKFRVVSGNISFYTTAKQIREGVGGFLSFNLAAMEALQAFENYRSGDGVEGCSTGLAGTWENIQIQLDVI